MIRPSPRERQIMEILIGSDMSTAEIARMLGIGDGTVRTCILRLCKKLGIDRRDGRVTMMHREIQRLRAEVAKR